MEQGSYENVHQLYPEGSVRDTERIDTIRKRESWGVMFEKLSTDMTNLWERQSALISTELNEKVSVLKTAAGSMITGGVFLFVGVLCLAATAIMALSLVVVPWVAAAIVTVAFLLIGLIMVKGAQQKIAGRGLVPDQSIDAMKEMKTTFQERIHEFKRQ